MFCLFETEEKTEIAVVRTEDKGQEKIDFKVNKPPTMEKMKPAKLPSNEKVEKPKVNKAASIEKIEKPQKSGKLSYFFEKFKFFYYL